MVWLFTLQTFEDQSRVPELRQAHLLGALASTSLPLGGVEAPGMV